MLGKQPRQDFDADSTPVGHFTRTDTCKFQSNARALSKVHWSVPHLLSLNDTQIKKLSDYFRSDRISLRRTRLF